MDSLHLNCNIGIASFNTSRKFSNIHNAIDLLEAANKAMYNAMMEGENKIEIYHEREELTAANQPIA